MNLQLSIGLSAAAGQNRIDSTDSGAVKSWAKTVTLHRQKKFHDATEDVYDECVVQCVNGVLGLDKDMTNLTQKNLEQI